MHLMTWRALSISSHHTGRRSRPPSAVGVSGVGRSGSSGVRGLSELSSGTSSDASTGAMALPFTFLGALL